MLTRCYEKFAYRRIVVLTTLLSDCDIKHKRRENPLLRFRECEKLGLPVTLISIDKR